MTKIVFLDIDGPMIPGRAAFMPDQTRPYFTKFDPVAVGLLNRLCEQNDALITVHSSWRKGQVGLALKEYQGISDLKQHLLDQGILEIYFHQNAIVPIATDSRFGDIEEWLKNHSDVTEYVILEDLPPTEKFENRTCIIDYNEGFTWERYLYATDILGGKEKEFFS